MSGNEQVRKEMQAFLEAIQSYPARFAANPGLTFEEHWTIERLAVPSGVTLEKEPAVNMFSANA
jgi:hypothetical protein